MLSVYPAIFFHEKEGGYSVVFPDLNHLATCGDTIQEAMEMAVDCLAGYIHSEQLDGHTLPQPTPLEKVDVHCEDSPEDDYPADSRFINLISVDAAEYARVHFNKAVKKTLSIPQWMNDMAVARKINFSKVLQNALMREMDVKKA